MGLYLSSAGNSTDANKHEAQSALMEVFGRLDGTHVDKGYSTHGKSKKQIEAMEKAEGQTPRSDDPWHEHAHDLLWGAWYG